MKIRLDKYLTEMGCGSRSQVKKEIAKGFVVINDQIENSPIGKLIRRRIRSF